MATPANCGARNRLADMDWLTSPQNLLNWADKGAIQLNRLIPALKKVYIYLDKLIDIEHRCYLAHTRAKFKYAYEQGCKLAFFFLYMIGSLYRLEEGYRQLKLSPQKIYERRNYSTTTEIVEPIRTRLYELLAGMK